MLAIFSLHLINSKYFAGVCFFCSVHPNYPYFSFVQYFRATKYLLLIKRFAVYYDALTFLYTICGCLSWQPNADLSLSR